MIKCRITVALALALAGLSGVRAEAPQVHALTGARLVLEPGRILESGTLVQRDGVIEAVGADVSVPADARLWELDGLTVYPGLIETYAERPWPEKEATFMVTDGDPLEIRTRISRARIAGREVDFSADRRKRLFEKYDNRPRSPRVEPMEAQGG